MVPEMSSSSVYAKVQMHRLPVSFEKNESKKNQLWFQRREKVALRLLYVLFIITPKISSSPYPVKQIYLFLFISILL